MLASTWDQFFTNVVTREGQLHQILRDVGFMLPDLLQILLPVLEIRGLAKSRRVPASHLISTNEAAATFGFVLFMVLFSIAVL